MVKKVISKVKPKHGFAHVLHLGLVALMPVLAYLFVRLEFMGLALAVILLSKWRMLAVSPRHWISHVRTNAVDIVVSVSIVYFMISSSDTGWLQLAWLGIFEIWVLLIKPRTSTIFVSIQALLSQCLGLVSVFLVYSEVPIAVYVLAGFIVSYFSARHFFNAYEESHGIEYAWMWAFFASSIIWVFSHWLLFYGSISQPALVVSIVGYGLAGIYYLHEHDKLTNLARRQIIFFVFALIVLIVSLSKWGKDVLS